MHKIQTNHDFAQQNMILPNASLGAWTRNSIFKTAKCMSWWTVAFTCAPLRIIKSISRALEASRDLEKWKNVPNFGETRREGEKSSDNWFRWICGLKTSPKYSKRLQHSKDKQHGPFYTHRSSSVAGQPSSLKRARVQNLRNNGQYDTFDFENSRQSHLTAVTHIECWPT